VAGILIVKCRTRNSIMFILDINKLEAGDIFLTTKNQKISKAIRLATSSDYSHAILYVGDSSYIHSDGKGVHSGNIQRLLFDSEYQVTVLRIKSDINREQINNACLFARIEVGKQYSVKDAINTMNPLSKKGDSNRQFCSRLVAQSFESVGLKLVENSSYCTPHEIESSPLTRQIENYLREASDAEVQFAESENPIERQSLITNQIFTKNRKLTRQDIQTFDQLINFLINNRLFDSKITQIIQVSGYLLIWQHEVNANPWRYDAVLFMSIPLSQDKLRELAQSEIESAEKMKKRFDFIYQQFMDVWQVYRLRYAAIHISLYQKLLELSDLRISVAKYVQKNN
jgi:hypothetical protein